MSKAAQQRQKGCILLSTGLHVKLLSDFLSPVNIGSVKNVNETLPVLLRFSSDFYTVHYRWSTHDGTEMWVPSLSDSCNPFLNWRRKLISLRALHVCHPILGENLYGSSADDAVELFQFRETSAHGSLTFLTGLIYIYVSFVKPYDTLEVKHVLVIKCSC